MPAAYFDVDGTLARTNLIQPTLFYLARQQTPLASLRRIGDAALRAPALALAELKDRKKFNEELFALFAGMSEDRIRLLAEEAFDSGMRRSLYTAGRDLVKRAQAEGLEVVFVSGCLDVIIERLADMLGVETFFANKLEFHDHVATGRLLPPVVAGAEKARILREHAASKGHALDECWAYADSASDIPMLSVVGKPTAVNPDARLEQTALGMSWPVLKFEGEASTKTVDKARAIARAFAPSWERAAGAVKLALKQGDAS